MDRFQENVLPNFLFHQCTYTGKVLKVLEKLSDDFSDWGHSHVFPYSQCMNFAGFSYDQLTNFMIFFPVKSWWISGFSHSISFSKSCDRWTNLVFLSFLRLTKEFFFLQPIVEFLNFFFFFTQSIFKFYNVFLWPNDEI